MPLRALLVRLSVFLVAALLPSVVTAHHFRVFVNNRLVSPGATVTVAPGSTVQFQIYQPSDGQVKIDLVGDGRLRQVLSGRPVFFSTAYHAGTYYPRVAVGSEAQDFTLSVVPPSSGRRLEDLLTRTAWPIVTLVIFLLMLVFGGLRDFLRSFRMGTIELPGGIKITSADLEITIWKAVKSTEKSLEQTFPPEKSSRCFPPSLEQEAAYDVHIVEFLNSIKIEVKNVAAWNAVGSYYFIHNPEKAKEAYGRAIMYAPDDPSGYTNLGMWYWTKPHQDPHSALQNFQKAAEVAEKRGLSAPWAYVGMTSVYGRLEKLDRLQAAAEKSKHQFEATITADPSDFWAYYGLGWCYNKLADRAMAIHYMEKALSLRPDFATARYNLACYKALNGDVNGTVEELSRILHPLKPILEKFGFPQDHDFDRVRDDAAFKAFAKILEH